MDWITTRLAWSEEVILRRVQTWTSSAIRWTIGLGWWGYAATTTTDVKKEALMKADDRLPWNEVEDDSTATTTSGPAAHRGVPEETIFPAEALGPTSDSIEQSSTNLTVASDARVALGTQKHKENVEVGEVRKALPIPVTPSVDLASILYFSDNCDESYDDDEPYPRKNFKTKLHRKMKRKIRNVREKHHLCFHPPEPSSQVTPSLTGPADADSGTNPRSERGHPPLAIDIDNRKMPALMTPAIHNPVSVASSSLDSHFDPTAAAAGADDDYSNNSSVGITPTCPSPEISTAEPFHTNITPATAVASGSTTRKRKRKQSTPVQNRLPPGYDCIAAATANVQSMIYTPMYNPHPPVALKIKQAHHRKKIALSLSPPPSSQTPSPPPARSNSPAALVPTRVGTRPRACPTRFSDDLQWAKSKKGRGRLTKKNVE